MVLSRRFCSGARGEQGAERNGDAERQFDSRPRVLPGPDIRAGAGYFDGPEKGLFDAIIGTAAAREIPAPLAEQLKAGGRMILPVGDRFGLQYLILVLKDKQGQLHRRRVMPVLFVPMTGRVQQSQKNPGAADNE